MNPDSVVRSSRAVSTLLLELTSVSGFATDSIMFSIFLLLQLKSKTERGFLGHVPFDFFYLIRLCGVRWKELRSQSCR